MPRKDTIHDAVRNALIKDGWTIMHDPYRVPYGNEAVFIDLAAEIPLTAERNGQRIAVEIKSFIGHSPINDLCDAMGQYIVYLSILEDEDPACTLYLALSSVVYGQMLQMKAFLNMRQKFQVPLIVVEIAKEEIVQWIA